VRDEDIFAMMPSSQRKLFMRCAEELLRYGAVGEMGFGANGFAERPCGNLGELDDVSVPVLRAALELRPSVVEAVDTGEGVDGKSPDIHQAVHICSASFVLESKTFRLSLTRAQDKGDFTLGIGEAETGAMHLLHFSDCVGGGSSVDGAMAPPLGIHGEVRDVGGIKLMLLAHLDIAPRALRIAVVEPLQRRAFQFVVLDSKGEDDLVLPFPLDSPARQELLAAHLGGFGSEPLQGQAALSASTPGSSRPPTSGQQQVRIKENKLIHRELRKLPSGQPVLLSVVRELPPDGILRFRVIMYHPLTSQEMFLLLVNPLLDRVLAACGLGSSLTVPLEAVDAASKEVAAQILPFVYVHPDGAEIELRAAPASQQQQPAAAAGAAAVPALKAPPPPEGSDSL